MQETAKHHAERAVLAAQEGRWTDALRHAHACRQLSPVGSMWHVWSLHLLACTYTDTGKHRLAGLYALAFLRQVSAHPGLARFIPYVLRVQAHVAYHQRRFLSSANFSRQALALFEEQGDTEQATRTALYIAWAYARAGYATAARQSLPPTVPTSMDHLYRGAQTAVLAAEGRWAEALKAGSESLEASRAAHDHADAAEVCLILVMVSRHLRAPMSQTLRFLHKAAIFASRQERSLYSLLVLSRRENGGENLHVRAATARGSADLLDRGCFTSGVA